VNAAGFEVFGPADIVHVMRVPAVDDDVAGLEQRRQLVQRRFNDGRREHQPDRARCIELLDELAERARSSRPGARQLLYACGLRIEHDAVVSTLQQAAHHAAAHASKTDHSELHMDKPTNKFEPGWALHGTAARLE
jgi:hypothetical protein